MSAALGSCVMRSAFFRRPSALLTRSSSHAVVRSFRTSRVVALAEGKQAGVVKWFNNQKGFGFISPTQGGEDVFVHQTSIIAEGFRSLAEGEPVEYGVEADASGRLRATQVTGPDGAQVQGNNRSFGGRPGPPLY